MLIHVTVKTGRREEKIIPTQTTDASTAANTNAANTAYTVYLRAKPHDGAANTALINLLAKHFHVPKTSITIVRGHTSHLKTISLPD